MSEEIKFRYPSLSAHSLSFRSSSGSRICRVLDISLNFTLSVVDHFPASGRFLVEMLLGRRQKGSPIFRNKLVERGCVRPDFIMLSVDCSGISVRWPRLRRAQHPKIGF